MFEFNKLYTYPLFSNTEDNIEAILLRKTFNRNGSTQGNHLETLVGHYFGLPFVSTSGNDSKGDFVQEETERKIECRLITKNGTYLTRSSEAGAKRDIGGLTEKQYTRMRNQDYCFGFYKNNKVYIRFVKGESIEIFARNRGKTATVTKKQALKEFMDMID